MQSDRPEELGPEDVATLRAMTAVSLGARGRATSASLEYRPDVDQLSEGVLRSVAAARATQTALLAPGPARWRSVKWVLLRIGRPLTARLTAGERHLADAVEAMAMVLREQTGQAQRMNDSMRALVASADSAVSEAIDELGEVAVPSTTGDGRLALLEARLSAIEAQLDSTAHASRDATA